MKELNVLKTIPTIRTHSKVLEVLVNLSRKYNNNTICKPTNFEENFRFIPSELLVECLKILASSGLIDVEYADYPECFNIYTLQITPEGLNYHPLRRYNRQQKWIERIITFMLGVFSGYLLTYVIPWIHTALTKPPC